MKQILIDWLKTQQKESYADLLNFDIDEIGEIKEGNGLCRDFEGDTRVEFINAIREEFNIPLLTFEQFNKDKENEVVYCDNPSCLKQGCTGECEEE